MLVEPKHGGNVGAAARAMANFGFHDLAIVGEVPSLEGEAEWWATSGGEVLESVTRFETLGSAVADCEIVVATTSARGRDPHGALTPSTTAELFRSLGAGERLALVFGRERSGLSSDEIALCARVATIPASPEKPVLNLAQAVAIFCFVLQSRETADEADGSSRATHDSVERLHHAALELLDECGWTNPQNREATYGEIRRLAARAELTEREVTLLLGMIRQIDWWGRSGVGPAK